MINETELTGDEPKMKKPCLECKLNAGAVIALSVCRFLKEENLFKNPDAKLDCEKLEEEAINGELSQDKLVDTVIENTADPDIILDLKEVKKMMYEASEDNVPEGVEEASSSK